MEEVVDVSEILATSNLVVEGHVTSTSISSKATVATMDTQESS
jgi:hypothetical protein